MAAENDLASSPEAGARGRLSSPQDNPRRGSELSSQTPSSTYPPLQSKETAGPKRKRSQSEEQERYGEQHSYEYSPSQRPGPQHLANRALHVLVSADQNGGGYYQNGSAGNQTAQTWSSSPSNPNRPTTAETRLAEALQQETDGQEGQRGSWDTEHSTNGETNAGGPKRKRNFSNRTKTGCLTCRARKKKCDEQHPTCANCIRGGFECKGYTRTTRRNMWPANGGSVRPVMPLQSKDAQSDVPTTPVRTNVDSPTSSRASGPYEAGHIRPGQVDDPNGQRQQQYTTSPSSSHKETRIHPPYLSQQQWTQGPPPQAQPQIQQTQQIQQIQPAQQQSQPAQTQPLYTSDHLPPVSEVNRSEHHSNVPSRDMSRPSTQVPIHSQHPPHPPPPLSQPQPQMSPQHPTIQASPASLSRPPPLPLPPPPPPPPPPAAAAAAPAQQQTPHWPSQPPSDYRSPYGNLPGESHDRGHVRLPSSGLENPKSGSKTFTKEDVERSKMLRHTSYNHHDPTLVNERQRCKQALARYNQACALDHDASEEEIRNKLLKVVDPSRDTTHKFISHPPEKGTIGHGSRIEAPFKCTYGYNIKIMEDVFIGENCEIDDCGKVDIGPRTFIGSGVTIFTQSVGKDLVDRKGTGAPWIAQQVSIASEVIIGKGAVVYPGVTIGRGATVEPFAIVRDSLGEFQTQCAATGRRL
ncbi:hypothetical protein ABEF91_002034 [Exophiala dermatitidis]